MTNQQFVQGFFNNPYRGDSQHQNLIVEDGVLYSYGKHFPLAIWGEDGKFYVNADTYSRTTGKHRRLCLNLGAIPVDSATLKDMIDSNENIQSLMAY